MSFVGMLYACLTLPYSHWCIISPVCIVWYCDGHIYTYRRGASALLVSTDRAISYEPQGVKRATVQGFTLEPKYKTYFSDNQVYNSENSMD